MSQRLRQSLKVRVTTRYMSWKYVLSVTGILPNCDKSVTCRTIFQSRVWFRHVVRFLPARGRGRCLGWWRDRWTWRRERDTQSERFIVSLYKSFWFLNCNLLTSNKISANDCRKNWKLKLRFRFAFSTSWGICRPWGDMKKREKKVVWFQTQKHVKVKN